MEIRKADPAMVPRLLEIYAGARRRMAASGNPNQWKDGYPGEAEILRDLEKGRCYVCMEKGEILGTFCYFYGEDPTYRQIYGGKWLEDGPSGVIHRVAVEATGRGVASFCLRYGLEQAGNLRIDTHRDNLPMQKTLERNGFVPCGTIYLANGDPRIAYQKKST